MGEDAEDRRLLNEATYRRIGELLRLGWPSKRIVDRLRSEGIRVAKNTVQLVARGEHRHQLPPRRGPKPAPRNVKPTACCMCPRTVEVVVNQPCCWGCFVRLTRKGRIKP